MRESVTVYLDWVFCAQFAGLCWAEVNGLYADAGLDVTLVPWFDDGRSVIEKVQQTARTGQLCVGSVEDNLLVRSAGAGTSVRAFGAMLQDTPMVLMSRPEQGIRSFDDLRGKQIGMHADGIRALEVILALEGISVSEVAIREIGFDLDHLIMNHVDALQGYAMTEPFQLASMGVKVDLLPVKHARLQPYAQIYFGEQFQLTSQPNTYATFLEASTAGWRAVCTDPQAAAIAVAQVMQDPNEAPLQQAMLNAVIPLVAGQLSPDRMGTINTEQWQRNLDTYQEFGIVNRPLTLRDVMCEVPFD